MEKPRANTRQSGAGRGQKSRDGGATRGRGGRSSRGGRSRGGSRGRGGRGGRGGDRVVFAWHDGDEEDEEEDEKLINGGAERFMTDSDFERQELEIDDAVEMSAMETFAGTMIVDADDVDHKREKKNAKKKKKEKIAPGEGQASAAKKGEEEEHEEEGETPVPKEKKAKKKNAKKTAAVSGEVVETAMVEGVQVDRENVDGNAGESVEITVKAKAKKNKKKKTANAADGSVPGDDVVEVKPTVHENKKKKAKKTAQPPVNDNALETLPEETDKPVTQTAKKQKQKKVKEAPYTPGKAEGTQETKKAPAPSEKPTKSEGSSVVEGHDGKWVKDGRRRGEDSVRKEWKNFYEDYSDRNAVMEALERGELYQGKLRINPQYRLRAFVTVAGIPVDVLVDGVRDRNRGMDGDLVAIKLLDEDKWKPLNDKQKEDDDGKKETKKLAVEMLGPVPSGTVDEKETKVKSGAALHGLWRPTLDASRCFLPQSATTSAATAVSASVTTARGVFERSQALKCRPTAKVVFILAAGNAQGFVGSLEPKTKPADDTTALSPQDDYAYFNAEDPRIPRRIRIPRLQLPDQFVSQPLKYSNEMMCFCRITKWSVSHESPVGEFVKTLGEYTGIESGISAVLMKHGLMQHTNDFRQEILDELDARYGAGGEKWSIPDDEVAKRRDFRSYQIFSIDPYNARDLDDALHIRALDAAETQFEVGVHIADVTHFIEKSSLLDVEAQQRATSVYLANRVLPMLPRILCERLCSLQPQVDRLAFSVVWHMNRDGSLVEGNVPWFGKSIIRSCCKLDYGTAQHMLDGVVTKDKLDEWEEDRRPVEGDNAEITPASVIQAVKYLWLVGKNRRETRFDTGAVTLQNVKLTFTLDAMGNPTSFGTYQLKNSNRLVEEYMLLANYLVAQRLLQAHGPLAFIRRHPEPNAQSLETTLSVLSENSIQVDGSSPKKLSESLDAVQASYGDYEYGVVQNMITKPMKPAEYLVAGTAGNEAGWRHYALNIPYYTHFTSPIRRYADVVVHRLLQESIVDSDAVASRLEAAGDELTGLMDELQAVAGNCNEKKMTSKNAEKDCDQIFLCAYIKHNGDVDVTGVVVSTGQRSFTVYISELGVEQRVEIKDLGSGVKSSWQEKTSTLSLVFGKTKRPRRMKKKSGKEDESVESKEASEEQDVKQDVKQDEGGSGAKNGVSSGGSATVNATATASGAEVERVDLKFLTKLRMRMTTTDRMPLALKFDVVGPWTE